jgi:TAG lipase/steryl ester hydrolase/phospholipase A2/LPA acyltransferase
MPSAAGAAASALALLTLPARRALALALLAGRSWQSLARALVAAAFAAAGRAAAPVTTPWLRSRPGSAAVLRRWHVALVAAVAGYYGRRALAEATDRARGDYGRRKALRADMHEAATYADWSLAATKLDCADGTSPAAALARWRAETRVYDRRLLTSRLDHLRSVRARGDTAEMMFALRTDLLRNLGNMASAAVHEAFRVAPEPIRAYTDEVALHLAAVADAAADGRVPLDETLNFVRETRHAFGRTALVLSGGGALGAFHVGVVKALLDARLLPRVLAGSSAGAIVAATIATRSDAELDEMFAHADAFDLSFFANSTASQFARHLLLKGTLQDNEVLAKRLRRLLGDATFLQAFQHSGRVLNVAVSPADTLEPPRVLNYLTAPHVVVWSAVACSSAFPLLFLPQDLLCRDAAGRLVPFAAEGGRDAGRRWRDGSLEEDLPMQSLSEMFNVNYFLVSQTNPHVVPWLQLKAALPRALGVLLEAEWKHRCGQLMAAFPRRMRWLKVACQAWEGDVTLVLPHALSRVAKSITNPTSADLREAARCGERAAWGKLSAIAANCGVEGALDAAMLRLSGEAAARKAGAARAGARAGRVRSRIPSWVSLPASGLPHVPSDDSLDARVAVPSAEPAFGAASADGGGGGRALPALAEAADEAASPRGPPSSAGSADSPREGPFLGRAPSPDSPLGDSPGARRVPPRPAPAAPAEAAFAASCLPFDCCDRSVDLWGSVMPAGAGSGGDGLDVVAP